MRQETEAGRDAYIAARDVTVIHQHALAGLAQTPGSVRTVWGNVPARNPGFTGREQLLTAVRDALLSGDRAIVQALHGISGVGKTQIAVEYAHRFAGSYNLVWWVAAEQTGQIGGQFAALAEALGSASPRMNLATVRRAVLGELHDREQWLLVFDNAENPQDVMPWLPGGSGHVLITSRVRRWAEVAVPIEVDVLSRADSVAMLRSRVSAMSEDDADRVAEAVGDLPLAIAQAAGTMADTGMAAAEYNRLLTSHAAEMLDQGRPASYPRSLAAVTQLAFDQLQSEAPAAADLVGICAFLASETIPASWFPRACEHLPGLLAEQAADPVAWRKVLSQVGHHVLAHVDPDGIVMHRLTQAVLRQYLSGQAAPTQTRAVAILAANRPGDGADPAAWLGWARLLPHVLALDPVSTSSTDLRDLASEAAWYLVRRGDIRSGYDLACRLYNQWGTRLGADDRRTLWAATTLAHALRAMGRYEEARQLDEESLAWERRLGGNDHHYTLIAASHLAIDLRALGLVRAAQELHEDTLARRRRVLGEDHPSTLSSASNLAEDLRALGEVQAARDLDEDTLARRRRVLGEDHPSTLVSASNLAEDLRALGEVQAARDLDEDTLARRRRVLGEDHPSTLISASNLAEDLRAQDKT